MSIEEHGAIARSILDGIEYMTLATVDPDGHPWATPVYCASRDYRNFYWVSSPEVAHSRNLARHPRVSLVVFDSTVPAGSGQGVYMAATAKELSGPELAEGLEVFPRPALRATRTYTAEGLSAPALYRLYRATVSQHWILCPRVSGPCSLHGLAHDHRAEVVP